MSRSLFQTYRHFNVCSSILTELFLVDDELYSTLFGVASLFVYLLQVSQARTAHCRIAKDFRQFNNPLGFVLCSSRTISSELCRRTSVLLHSYPIAFSRGLGKSPDHQPKRRFERWAAKHKARRVPPLRTQWTTHFEIERIASKEA